MDAKVDGNAGVDLGVCECGHLRMTHRKGTGRCGASYPRYDYAIQGYTEPRPCACAKFEYAEVYGDR